MNREFPFHLADRFRVEGVYADSGGMGILLDARDERCADNRVLIKTTRYDSGDRARNLRYTVDEAVDYIRSSRKILEWERKVLVRFRNDGLNNIPSANHWFLAPSLTLDARYEGKLGSYELPRDLLESEPFLVMEFISGKMLEDAMHEAAFRERLEENLLTLAREILTILIRMHREVPIGQAKGQFLYQDMKPANILVSDEDYFTLIDFGGTTLRLGGRTTEPTAGCITMGYAAPEADGGNEAYIDQRFDLYTLGATLWQAVTLRDPRDMGDAFPVLDPMAMQGVSDGFRRMVATAMSRNPDKRYPSAPAMRKDVMECLRQLRT